MPSLDILVLQYCANDPGDCTDINTNIANGTIFDYCSQHTGSPLCQILIAQGCDASLLDHANMQNCITSNLSSFVDSTTKCTAQADLDTANLDALVQQLATGWFPTGYFTSQVIIQVIGKWNERSQAARAAVTAALALPNASYLKDRLDDLSLFDQQAQKYLQAAQDAGTDGIVEADKLKDWATGGLTAISASLHAAEVVTCQHDQDWSALVALGQFFWTVGGVAKQVADAAYQAGKNVVKASEWLLGALGWIVTHPWTVFGGVAAVVAAGFAFKHRDTLKSTFTRFKRS